MGGKAENQSKISEKPMFMTSIELLKKVLK